MTSISGHWHEVHSLGLVILGTSESQVGSDLLLHCDCITHNTFSSHVLCLPTVVRYRYLVSLLQGGALNESVLADIAKNTYQNITAEKLRLVQFLLRREQTFEKNDQHLSASIKVRYSYGFFQRH